MAKDATAEEKVAVVLARESATTMWALRATAPQAKMRIERSLCAA